jgi:hypothetical protein
MRFSLFGITISTVPEAIPGVLSTTAVGDLLRINDTSLPQQIALAKAKKDQLAKDAKDLEGTGRREIDSATAEFDQATQDLQIKRNKKVAAAQEKIYTANGLIKTVAKIGDVLSRFPE